MGVRVDCRAVFGSLGGCALPNSGAYVDSIGTPEGLKG